MMIPQIEVITRRKRPISTVVENSLREYMGVAWYDNVSILYCRNCNRVIGEIPNNGSTDGWFNPARTCSCGSIPLEDFNIGPLAGEEKARRIMQHLGLIY